MTGHPARSTAAEVWFGRTTSGVPGRVVSGGPERIVVAAPEAAATGRTAPKVGDRAELVWADATALVRLPVQLSAVQRADSPLWHFRPVGEATRGQRRAAVRVPLILPVQLRGPDRVLSGRTWDLSEGGLHCTLDTGPPGPATGDRLSVTLHLHTDDQALLAEADVLRCRTRGDGRLAVVLAFVDLSEGDQDRVRRRVFQELRNRRAQGLW